MFWVIDNFLMRKSRKYITTNAGVMQEIEYKSGKQHYGASDDEAGMHLIDNESNDTLMHNISENEYLHHRSDSSSR